MTESRYLKRVMKRVVLALFTVVVCVFTAAAYYFHEVSSSEEPPTPFHVTAMNDYVKRRVTRDLSGFEIEHVAGDALILTLSKWRTRISVLCYRSKLGGTELPDVLSLVPMPEHSRRAPFDPPLEPGWCAAGGPAGDPGASRFSAGCIETQSCDEDIILDCAINYMAGVLAGPRVLMDGRTLRWTDEDEFREYCRSMRASFDYEKVDVYRYSRSIDDVGRSELARFDVVVAPNDEILGSAVYFLYMSQPL